MNKQTNKCNNTANYTEFIAIEIALTSATHTHSQLGNLILSMSIGPKATTEHKFVCSLWLLCYCFRRSISIFNLFFLGCLDECACELFAKLTCTRFHDHFSMLNMSKFVSLHCFLSISAPPPSFSPHPSLPICLIYFCFCFHFRTT